MASYTVDEDSQIWRYVLQSVRETKPPNDVVVNWEGMIRKTGSTRKVSSLKSRFRILLQTIHNSPFHTNVQLELYKGLKVQCKTSHLNRLQKSYDVITNSEGLVVNFFKRDAFSKPLSDSQNENKLTIKVSKKSAKSLKSRIALLNKLNLPKKEKANEFQFNETPEQIEEMQEVFEPRSMVMEAEYNDNGSMYQFFDSLRDAVTQDTIRLVQQSREQWRRRVIPCPERSSVSPPSNPVVDSICSQSINHPENSLTTPGLILYAGSCFVELKEALVNLSSFGVPLTSEIVQIDKIRNKMRSEKLSIEKVRLALDTALAIISPNFQRSQV